jgi:hypothetical protein
MPTMQKKRPRPRSGGVPKLTPAQAQTVCARYAAGGVTYRALADEYDCAVSVICRIINQHTAAPPGQRRGERHPLAKLTAADVAAMREQWAAGAVRQADLARAYAISSAHLRGILTGRLWPDVGSPQSRA